MIDVPSAPRPAGRKPSTWILCQTRNVLRIRHSPNIKFARCGKNLRKRGKKEKIRNYVLLKMKKRGKKWDKFNLCFLNAPFLYIRTLVVTWRAFVDIMKSVSCIKYNLFLLSSSAAAERKRSSFSPWQLPRLRFFKGDNPHCLNFPPSHTTTYLNRAGKSKVDVFHLFWWPPKRE